MLISNWNEMRTTVFYCKMFHVLHFHMLRGNSLASLRYTVFAIQYISQAIMTSQQKCNLYNTRIQLNDWWSEFNDVLTERKITFLLSDWPIEVSRFSTITPLFKDATINKCCSLIGWRSKMAFIKNRLLSYCYHSIETTTIV